MPLVKVLALNSESISSSPRATLLTLLRLTTNALGAPSLSRLLLLSGGAEEARGGRSRAWWCRRFCAKTGLCARVAAASLAFNVGAWVQRGRVARTKVGREEVVYGIRADEENGEWEVEHVSAVVEALAGEEESDDAGELYVSCARLVGAERSSR